MSRGRTYKVYIKVNIARLNVSLFIIYGTAYEAYKACEDEWSTLYTIRGLL